MTVENEAQLEALRRIGRIVALTLAVMRERIQPGMTTAELDAIGARELQRHGARSAPILAYNYPGATCISINDEAAHGIPGPRVIQPGDLVNIDVSAELAGYYADSGASVAIPPVAPGVRRLCEYTARALEAAIGSAKAGARLQQVGRAIQRVASRGGYHCIRELGGHGIGRKIHEAPSVPNWNNRAARGVLSEGQVITLEPFLTTGAIHVNTAADGWTLRTTDGSLAAQYEHTVVITRGRPILLTVA